MNIRDAFRAQAEACEALGSAFTARLCLLAAERLDDRTAVGRRILDWPGDASARADSVPLRLAGALHRLVLSDDRELARHWPPARTTDDALWRAVEDALRRRETDVLIRLDCAPQTNELRRSAALIPALHLVARWSERPLALFELGASAGLNLLCDRFALRAEGWRLGPADPLFTLTPHWSGPRLPIRPALSIAARRGVDLHPLSASVAADRLTLLSYLWPDQPDRRTRTEIALDAAQEVGVRVDLADAGAWLADRLPLTSPEHLPVVFHTIAWQYFSAETRTRAETALADVGRTRPLARIAMEADGETRGAALTLTLWPQDETVVLGRADFHGRWIEWTGPACLVRAAC